MPLKPNAIIWGALLNTCCIHGDVQLGTWTGKILIEVEPRHARAEQWPFMLLLNNGIWIKARKVRRQVRDQGVSKVPGCGAISHSGIVRELLADDVVKIIAARKHSGKTAFYLISTEQGMTICTVNNLRVCKGCHTIAKLVSGVYDRKTVLQGRTQFHHLEMGTAVLQITCETTT
ncbi:hypothetical protein Ancab_025840 [Ancistrocladus abbreviatus]